MEWHELDNIPVSQYSRVFKERTRDWWMWILRDKLYLRNEKNVVGFTWEEWDMFQMLDSVKQYERVDDRLMYDTEKELYFHFDHEIISRLWMKQ